MRLLRRTRRGMMMCLLRWVLASLWTLERRFPKGDRLGCAISARSAIAPIDTVADGQDVKTRKQPRLTLGLKDEGTSMSDAFKEEMESINTDVSCPSLALSAASSAWR
jgi:hypothetical protein